MPVSDNTTAEGMARNAPTFSGSLRMDSGALILKPCGFHRDKGFDMNCGVCASINGYVPSTQTPIPAQCELVSRDALDALREINPGCGCEFATTRCGKPLHEGTPHRLFCDECNTKREAAIDRLISETGEGNG